ncbi:hypothetical protein SAY86_021078 [Trapa natans]|uniref:Uncharacterized protein n=1 Tax=Trapa natans TaxID=22666 RepID=A0AAN7MA98_TRANT|nr:hypothetical protein SAY86_021078 [Trapa natans]
MRVELSRAEIITLTSNPRSAIELASFLPFSFYRSDLRSQSSIAEAATMWRRLAYSHLKTLSAGAASSAPLRSASSTPRFVINRCLASPSPAASSLFAHRHFSSISAAAVKRKAEDVMPIATGHELEELEAELEGKDLLDINYPVGPFGTKVNM